MSPKPNAWAAKDAGKSGCRASLAVGRPVGSFRVWNSPVWREFDRSQAVTDQVAWNAPPSGCLYFPAGIPIPVGRIGRSGEAGNAVVSGDAAGRCQTTPICARISTMAFNFPTVSASSIIGIRFASHGRDARICIRLDRCHAVQTRYGVKGFRRIWCRRERRAGSGR